MSDDEPIKERVIDRTGQAEREWVDKEADRRNERWEKRKRTIDSDRRMHRANMTALELHRHAVERAGRISTVGAAQVGISSPNVDRQSGPPKQQTLDDDPRWREDWYVIRRRLEHAHKLLDEAEGHGTQAVTMMFSEQKDQMILSEGRGLSCQAVVDLLGSEVAGSPRTVERVRRKNGYSTLDGEPLPDPGDPRVRRVKIG